MCIVVHTCMTCRISCFQDGESLNNYITIFLAEGIWKVHIFRHLFVCFQTSVYTLGEFHKNRNNSTVFEELELSIVDLMVANIRFTALATIKSTIDTSNSSNTVLLFLNYYKQTRYIFHAIRVLDNNVWLVVSYHNDV